jgi:hypothetical protein
LPLIGVALPFSLGVLFPHASFAAQKGVVPDMTWGVGWSDQKQDAAKIKEGQARWVRLNISWSDWVAPSPTSLSKSALNSFDRSITLARNAGAKVIIMINESPSWARDTSNKNAPPRNVADYVSFVGTLANRWKGQVAAYEVWNEPNIGNFYMSPSAYAAMLKATAPAIRAADPAAKVLYGGTAYNDFNYLEATYAAAPDLNAYFDVMVTHPFTMYQGSSPSPDTVWYDSAGRVDYQAFLGYRTVRDTLLAHGADKPIWFTEFGWSSENGDVRGVSAAQQAEYLTRAYQIITADPYVQVACWYNLRNNWWANNANDWEDQLGLLNIDFSPKPAWSAFVNAASTGTVT